MSIINQPLKVMKETQQIIIISYLFFYLIVYALAFLNSRHISTNFSYKPKPTSPLTQIVFAPSYYFLEAKMQKDPLGFWSVAN
jgi:hypothetical protein